MNLYKRWSVSLSLAWAFHSLKQYFEYPKGLSLILQLLDLLSCLLPLVTSQGAHATNRDLQWFGIMNSVGIFHPCSNTTTMVKHYVIYDYDRGIDVYVIHAKQIGHKLRWYDNQASMRTAAWLKWYVFAGVSFLHDVGNKFHTKSLTKAASAYRAITFDIQDHSISYYFCFLACVRR